jgi:hypothetical protein
MIAMPTLGGVCSPEGTNSAFASGSLAGGGTISASLSIGANAATASISGTSSSDFSGDVYMQIEVDVHVPDLGQATTPVFVSLEDVVTPAFGHLERISLEGAKMIPPCGTEDVLARPSSTLLGRQVGAATDGRGADDFAFYGKYLLPEILHMVQPHEFLAGDTVHLPIVAHALVTNPGGAFSGSFRVAFRTAAITLGSGDVNGDGGVNVLDVTLLRRAIAGLPPG